MPETFPTVDPDTGELVPVSYYSIEDISELLHMSESTIRRRIKSGEWDWYFEPLPGVYYMSPPMLAYVVESMTHAPPPPELDGPPPRRLGTPLSDTDLEGMG